jgi:hypothetical protein
MESRTLRAGSRFWNTRPWRLCLTLGALALLLPGCRPGGGAVQGSDAAETFTLATINGHELPFTPPHEGGAPEVRGGAITLKPDGSFTSSMTYGGPGGKQGSRDFSGTYTREGSKFKLRWKGAGLTTAILEGNTFTMDNEGVKFAYRK